MLENALQITKINQLLYQYMKYMNITNFGSFSRVLCKLVKL